MEQDTVVEPARQHLMPHMLEVRRSAKGAGALALVISGAGPTLCAICETSDAAQQVSMAMQAVYEGHGIPASAIASRVLVEGATVTAVNPMS
jgi:homoserine kinase